MMPSPFSRIALALACMGTPWSVLAEPAPAPGLPAAAWYTDQMIIKWKQTPGAGVSGRQGNVLWTRAGGQLSALRRASGSAHVYRLAEGDAHLDQVREVARQLMEDNPDIEYAEPDYRKFPAGGFTGTPNDPYFGEMWNLKDPATQTVFPWGGIQGGGGANLAGAWAISTGDAGVVVAVLDTGILAGHEDLLGRTTAGYDFLSSAVTANDGDGRDPDPSDPGDCADASLCRSSFHGTHVAGTIGARANNGLGITGINWVSKIQALRVLGLGGGPDSDIADAIRWAAGLPTSDGVTPWPQGVNPTPARVINLSLGGAGSCGITMQAAINAAVGNGAVVVVAAGNEGAGLTSEPKAPATCANVITVAAVAPDGSRASYSNYDDGATHYVTLAAPGGSYAPPFSDIGKIRSTLDGGKTAPLHDNAYALYQGTSMATPHVAGVVSLLLSVNPGLSPAQVKSILATTARPFTPYWGPLWDCTMTRCGAGMLDATAAVQMAQAMAVGAPTLVASLPANGATDVAVEARLVLNFSTAVSPGTAGQTLTVRRVSDQAVVEVFTVTGNALVGSAGGTATFDGNGLTLDPHPNLALGTAYYLTIDSAALKGPAGQYFGGISDPSTLRFTTRATGDTTPPTLLAAQPANGQNQVPGASNLVLTFSETIVPGDGGQTLTLEDTNGIPLETFTVQGGGFTGSAGGSATLVGNVLTLDPGPVMADNATYFLQIGANAIKDVAGNAYTSPLRWGFTTAAADTTPPELVFSRPVNGAANMPVAGDIGLRFSEPVVVGDAGQTLVLKRSADDSVVETFTANGSALTGSAGGSGVVQGGGVTLHPGANLQYDTGYYLQIGSTALKDRAGNPYAGIADSTTLAFFTVSVPDLTPPTLASSVPAANATGVAPNANLVLTFSEPMALGESGATIELRKGDGSVVETYTSNGYGLVPSGTGEAGIVDNRLIIVPGGGLQPGTRYVLQIGATALADTSGNLFAGLLGQNALSFTTAAADTTPDPFSFTPLSGVAPGAPFTSNTITVTGINTASPIQIVGGTYAINGGAETASPGTVNGGDTVSVTLSAAASPGTTTTATLTIGGVSAAFSVTTALAQGGVCGSANGHATAFMPSDGLCLSGTASSVTAGSPWTWTCANPIATRCTAPNQPTASQSGAGRALVFGGTWAVNPGRSAGFIPTSGHPKSPPSLPPGHSFPHGLFDFTLSGGAPGTAATLVLTYPSPLPPNTVYWKYGPSPDGYGCAGELCAFPHWYPMPASQVVISGNTVTLTLVDGGVGDDDLAADGTIVDAGGPGVPSGTPLAEIPTLSQWALLLLSLILGLGIRIGGLRWGARLGRNASPPQ